MKFPGLLITVLLSILLSFVGTLGQNAQRSDGTINGIEKIKIAEGIYQFKASSDAYVENCNSTVIVNDKDVWVFDTNTRTATARAILAEIRRITSKPVTTIVNSHWHPDHWTGKEVYAREFPNVQIISTAETLEFMKNVAPSWAPVFSSRLQRRTDVFQKEVGTGKHADGTPWTDAERRETEDDLTFTEGLVSEFINARRVYPNRTYRDKLTINHGGREFQLISVTGDAGYSTVLYLPKEKLLLTGDVLVYPVTWTTQNYRISSWLESLKMLDALDVATIIPGHGPSLFDKNYLNLVRELFESAIAQVRAALQKGLVTVDEVQAAVNFDSIRLKFTRNDKSLNDDFQGTLKSLIRKVYLESRDGMESSR